MIIEHNISAMNSQRFFKINNKNSKSSIQKLSSGYRISKAADDAAGLAISEKMRGQIRGLNQASDNIGDGISLIQTADGALQEVHNILQRAREIMVQAFTDTNTDEDKMQCQKEVDALMEEINCIGHQTEFNTIKVLRGDDYGIHINEEYIATETYSTTVTNTTREYEYPNLPSWVQPSGSKLQLNQSGIDSDTKQDTTKVMKKNDGTGKVIEVSDWTETLADNYSGYLDFSTLGSSSTKTDFIDKLNELANTGFYSHCGTCVDEYGIFFTTHSNDLSSKLAYAGITSVVYLDDFIDAANNATNFPLSAGTITKSLVEKITDIGSSKFPHFTTYTIDKNNPYKLVIYDYRDSNAITSNSDFRLSTQITLLKNTTTETKEVIHTKEYPVTIDEQLNNDLWIQSGANSGQGLWLKLPTIGVAELDLLDLSVFDRDSSHIETHSVAERGEAIYGYNTNGEWVVLDYKPIMTEYEEWVEERNSLDLLDKAIQTVSHERSRLGAMQNRLEHSQKNVDNAEENLQSSESRIRDVDMAEELTNYSKLNILIQASQSMIAQANQIPQNVLSLLQ